MKYNLRGGFIMKLKKIIMVLLLSIFLMGNICFVYADENQEEVLTVEEIEEIKQASSNVIEEPNINARAAVVIDRKSKDVIYEKNAYSQRPMASTTKIMTAVVVLENANLSDIVETSKKAAGTGGSTLGFKAGSKISVNDLLYGLLLVSGNDAAVALAEHIGGSVEGFSSMMNQKAKQLGLENTNFVTPHGLDMQGHYTTAYELALLTDYALENKKFAEIVNTKNHTITIQDYTKSLNNTNELLGTLNGVNGVKTGFTNGANRCLVTSTKRNDMEIITVVLGSDTRKLRALDSTKLIEHAYQNYTYINIKEKIEEEFDIWKKINQNRIEVNKGSVEYVTLEIKDLNKEFLSIKKEKLRNVEVEIDCLEYLESPVEKGSKIGSLRVLMEKEEVLQYEIIAKEEIKKRSILDYMRLLLKNQAIYIQNIF